MLAGLSAVLALIMTFHGAVSAATGPALMDTMFEARINHHAHVTYGLAYPLTYTFQLPAITPGLQAQDRYALTRPWRSVPTKVATDRFNGIAAARFDRVAGRLYISVPFTATSDTVYLRVVDAHGWAVPLRLRGIPRYYDNRHAAVTLSLDDVTTGNLLDFDRAIALLTRKGLDATLGVETGYMDAAAWATVRQWLRQGAVEVASHTRTHPCTARAYGLTGGYTAQVSGSRNDLLAALSMPISAHSVAAFIEPCGFASPRLRRAVVAADYLVERSTASGAIGYAPWGNDGAYRPVGPTYLDWDWPAGGGSAALRDQANAAFHRAYAAGGIYHLMDHPWRKLWWAGSYLDQHARYIAGRKDVWYTPFGALYQYHFMQDRDQVTVKAVAG